MNVKLHDCSGMFSNEEYVKLVPSRLQSEVDSSQRALDRVTSQPRTGTKHRGLTSLTFMQLVPGDDRVYTEDKSRNCDIVDG